MSERDPMRPSGRELRELLAPHPIGPFLAEHWGQKPLYIPGSPKKFDRLKFDLRALERAIRDEDHRRDRFHVRWVGADNRAKPKPADLARYSIRDGDLTVCADWINDRFDRLAAFCAGIKAALSLPGSVFMTCYASPHGHGFGTHWDCQAVFVLQIEGSKRWRFSAEPAVEWPPALLPNAGVVEEMVDRYPWLQVGFPDDCAERTFLEETLTPGDVLFLPAGTWHRASAIGCSVALTMACPPMTAADFVDDVIRGHLSHAVDWRRNVPPVPMESTPPDRLPREVKRFFAARLAELRSHVRSLRAEDLFETWTHHVAAFDTPLRMEDRPRAPELEAADTLRLATDFPVRYVARRGEGSVSVYFLDHRIDLAYEALPLVKGILKRPVFKARSAARWPATALRREGA
jgi:ribosomal protein L16 Arg81 hydroxylase